jgi:hypothetical protein
VLTGGQGIASGFRDASALAWRLALLQERPQAEHGRVLAAWYTERKQQLEMSLAATVQNGRYVTESDPVKSFIREWHMWALQLLPPLRKGVELGARAQGMVRYKYEQGLPFMPDMGGGRQLPQVYACDLGSGKIFFTDDVIFASHKTGLFRLLILPERLEHVGRALEGSRNIESLSQGLLRFDETTILIQSRRVDTDGSDLPSQDTLRLASSEEFAADVELCRNRPEPVGYDEFRLKREVQGKLYVILRHDRFVFATCDTIDELKWVSKQLDTFLG